MCLKLGVGENLFEITLSSKYFTFQIFTSKLDNFLLGSGVFFGNHQKRFINADRCTVRKNRIATRKTTEKDILNGNYIFVLMGCERVSTVGEHQRVVLLASERIKTAGVHQPFSLRGPAKAPTPASAEGASYS